MKITSGTIHYDSDSAVNRIDVEGVISEGRTFRILKARSGTKFVILKAAVHPDSMSTGILRREYELCRTLSHPCIVNTLGFEEHSPAGPAIVMEYIDGISLDDFVSGCPTIAQRKSALHDILDGIDYLHHRGILHNDLKPDNIIVTHNGVARIIDFGLSSSDDSIYKGYIGGSDGYSAPEILNGGTPAGAASDIYSTGLLIRLLFNDDRFASITEKCTDMLPERRYQSIPELRNALSARSCRPRLFAACAIAVIAITAVILPYTRKIAIEEKTSGLEESYEEMLSPLFNDAITRMKAQEFREDAIEVENEYFEHYLQLLDSLQKLYPATASGENSPEIVAFCAVGQRQQEYADSIQRSLHSKRKLPAKKQGAQNNLPQK